MTSGDSLTLASQSAEITDKSQCAQPQAILLIESFTYIDYLVNNVYIYIILQGDSGVCKYYIL